MKKIILFLFVIVSSNIFSQKTTVEEIYSPRLDQNREIKIKLPLSYDKELDKQYPLVLVLDSEFLYGPFEANIAYGNYWDDMPEVILVGINQFKSRVKDTEFDIQSGLPLNQGAKFFEFIGAELLPYLEKKYRIASFKAIAGLDYTAGFINAFLYKDVPLFNSFIVLSPRLAPEMEDRIPQRMSTIKAPAYYYLATADFDVKKYRERIEILGKNISAIERKYADFKYDDFKNATHYSLVLNAIPSALYQIFSLYQPISTIEYQEKIVNLKEGYVDYLLNKYKLIEDGLGLKIRIRLNDFKAIETAILHNKAYDEFEKLAQISGKQYENTMLYDYHMAMLYDKKEDYKKAFKFYQNAFAKNEVRDITKDLMLNRAEEIKNILNKEKEKKKEKGKKKKGEEEEVIEGEATEEVNPENTNEEPKEIKNEENPEPAKTPEK